MANKIEYISIINDLIKKSDDMNLLKKLPISKSDLLNNDVLCEAIVDYLSDIHMVIGFDENYNETRVGQVISEVIDFILLINEVPE